MKQLKTNKTQKQPSYKKIIWRSLCWLEFSIVAKQTQRDTVIKDILNYTLV